MWWSKYLPLKTAFAFALDQKFCSRTFNWILSFLNSFIYHVALSMSELSTGPLVHKNKQEILILRYYFSQLGWSDSRPSSLPMPMLPPQKMPYDIPFKKYFNFSLSLIINFLEHIEVWCRLSWAWPPEELEVELCPIQEVYH